MPSSQGSQPIFWRRLDTLGRQLSGLQRDIDVEILAAWLGAAILTAIAAAARGRSPVWWFCIGLLCSFMGLIAVLIMRPLGKGIAPIAANVIADGSSDRDCPFCAEPIKKAAVKCKHCGSKVKRQISDEFDDPRKPSWAIVFTCEDNAGYVKKCSQLSNLDLPMVLEDDVIRIGPYLNRSEALRVQRMLADVHHLDGGLEAYLATESA